MNEFSEQLKSVDGQAWLAMQYVLAELSEDQRAVFEDAMAVDTNLCEAVVEACRMSAGVVLACEADRIAVPRVIVRPRKSLSTRFGVIAACASLFALIVLMRLPIRDRMSENMSSYDDAAAAEALVGLLQDQLPSGADSDGEVDTAADDSLANLIAPEWLLSAVDLDEPAVSGDDEVPPDDSNLF